MNKIAKTIKNFLKKYEIDDSERIYLVAFSGGYDSMCLLYALKSVSLNQIIAIHLNHNWRGEESDLEEKKCADFCQKFGINFYSEKLPDDIEKNETVAREERYKFFEKCANKYNSNVLFTAHNKNDNAETLLYRIIKGTGVKGLQGISENRGIYYRPLLSVERSDIEKYCLENNLKPNNDSSNNDIIHKRNLIRNEILPLMSDINPEVITSINRLSKSADENNEIVSEYLKLIYENILKDGKYNTKKFLNLSEALKLRILYEIVSPLVPQNYDRGRIITLYNFILENKISKSGKVCSVTKGYNLFVNEKYFQIIEMSSYINDELLIVDKCGEYNIGGKNVKISKCNSVSDKKIDSKKNVIYADLSGLDLNFELRTRRDGDIIQPFGMEGHQKLKKYLNSRKIPNHEKDKLVLLTQGNEILLVCGIGTSEKIRVKTTPTHKIEIKE